VRDLKLGANTVNDRPVLAPVELERLSRRERERHKSAASARLLLDALLISPGPRKRRNPAIRTIIAEAHQIGVQLLDRALLLARPRQLPPQPR
jgi:predicted anti-sigma-YlaC factor YlaD|tara:strand:+ start:720 stop:998 length:279 start_codon:yes stop_codon:yes gene_type:complete